MGLLTVIHVTYFRLGGMQEYIWRKLYSGSSSLYLSLCDNMCVRENLDEASSASVMETGVKSTYLNDLSFNFQWCNDEF